MPTSPNMAIVTPTVSTTPGPEWASVLNAAFDRVDIHDHTSGKGVPVPTAGININADLTFNSNDAIGIRSVRLDNQAATLNGASDLRILYSKNGELAYRDASGNEVILTAAGSVAGASGTISGLSAPAAAAFSGVSNTFSWVFDTAKPARFATADIALYAYDGSASYTNAITLKAPTALATNYSWTLPTTAPAQNGIVSITTAGVVVNGAHDGLVGTPSVYFNGDTDTGIYRVGANTFGVACGGVLSLSVASNGIEAADGSSGAPAFRFLSDGDTGMYRKADGTIAFACNAGERMIIGPSQIDMGLAGSSATPSWCMNNDTNTGFYQSAADEVAITCAAVASARFSQLGLMMDINGSAATPSIRLNDSSTGLYLIGNDNVGMSLGGTKYFDFATSGVTVTGIVATTGGVEAGTSGGVFKVKIVTGSYTGGSGASTVFSGSTVLGAFGYFNSSIAGWTVIADVDGANEFHFSSSGEETGTVVRVSGTASVDYRVVVFYQ